jgi:hypothetical protein
LRKASVGVASGYKGQGGSMGAYVSPGAKLPPAPGLERKMAAVVVNTFLLWKEGTFP